MAALEATPIRAAWDTIKIHLEELSKDYAWRPEDVYAECLYKDAVLYRNTDGFVVLKQVTEPYTDDKQLFVWIACSYRNNGACFINEHYHQIEQLARAIGAKKIVFGTKRTGYDRVLNLDEWSVTRHYERLLSDG